MTSHRLPEITLTPELTEAAAVAKAWPFEEAKKSSSAMRRPACRTR